MRLKLIFTLLLLVAIAHIGGVFPQATPSTNVLQELDTQSTSSAGALEFESNSGQLSDNGSLTNMYTDAFHGFSLRYPAAFLEKEFSEWSAIVDNDTKASVWLGFCPPSNCEHLAGAPFSRSEESYAQDTIVTREDSSEIPAGEGRLMRVLSNRQFTTVHGTQALEQIYEVSGFEATTGNTVMVDCGPDTPCKVAGPFLRYIFFSEGKAPYVMSARTLFPQNERMNVIRNIASTVSY